MGPKEVPAEQLMERAIANGYEQGAHHAEDSVRDNKKYMKKTLEGSELGVGTL